MLTDGRDGTARSCTLIPSVVGYEKRHSASAGSDRQELLIQAGLGLTGAQQLKEQAHGVQRQAH